MDSLVQLLAQARRAHCLQWPGNNAADISDLDLATWLAKAIAIGRSRDVAY